MSNEKKPETEPTSSSPSPERFEEESWRRERSSGGYGDYGYGRPYRYGRDRGYGRNYGYGGYVRGDYDYGRDNDGDVFERLPRENYDRDSWGRDNYNRGGWGRGDYDRGYGHGLRDERGGFGRGSYDDWRRGYDDASTRRERVEAPRSATFDINSAMYEALARALREEQEHDFSEVVFRVDDGVVELAGQVRDRAAKRRAEDLALALADVTDVRNLLELRPAFEVVEPPPAVDAGPAIEHMNEMIAAMLPATAVPLPVQILQARRNAVARDQLMQEFGALTSADVGRISGSRAANKAALAHRWKSDGRIFAVNHQGTSYFPGFQFSEDGTPLPVIAPILKLLGERLSPWELALWFTGANGWLGGARPVDLLTRNPEQVVEAARCESEDLVF